jgi:predicted component of type VI protein secretion system
VWRRDIHPEQLFAELAKAATKMIAAGSTLSQSDKDLRLTGAPSLGAIFAPTYNLLRPALEARKKANTLGANRRIAEAVATENSAWKT